MHSYKRPHLLGDPDLVRMIGNARQNVDESVELLTHLVDADPASSSDAAGIIDVGRASNSGTGLAPSGGYAAVSNQMSMNDRTLEHMQQLVLRDLHKASIS